MGDTATPTAGPSSGQGQGQQNDDENKEQVVPWNPRFPLGRLTSANRAFTIIHHRSDLGGMAKIFKAQGMYPQKQKKDLLANTNTENQTINPGNVGGTNRLPNFFKVRFL